MTASCPACTERFEQLTPGVEPMTEMRPLFSTTAENHHHSRISTDQTDPKYPTPATCKLLMSNLNRY